MAQKPSNPKTRPKPRPKKPLLKSREATEATSEEFEREGMGIASKE
jgi:hypothetical protein